MFSSNNLRLNVALIDKAFQDLAFMIHGPLKIMSLTVDLHEHFVQMPAPSAGFHTFDPALTNLADRHRTKPMPRSCSKSHTLRRDGEKRTYNFTTKRIISRLVLKSRNGSVLTISRRYKSTLPASSRFALTKPSWLLFLKQELHLNFDLLVSHITSLH